MSKREDIFEKLDNLIEQNQFELVSDKVDDNKLKVIYLMNDAVESFIVFENVVRQVVYVFLWKVIMFDFYLFGLIFV